MSGFTKLFADIVTSTVWQEPNDCRVLWITILALKDEVNICRATVPALAKICNITIEECEGYLTKFQEPDPYSRSQEFEGRRIQSVDGGWYVLNGEKYRQLLRHAERREYVREKVAAHRAKKKAMVNTGNQDVTESKLQVLQNDDSNQSNQCKPIAEAEADIRKEHVEQGSTTPAEDINPPENPKPAPVMPSPTKPDRQAGTSAEVKEVFDYWVKVMGKGPTAKLTAERSSKVKARLRVDGYSVEQLKRAIDGCKVSAFHQGENDKERRFEDLELICRDGKHVENFIEYLGPTTPGNGGDQPADPEKAQKVLEEIRERNRQKAEAAKPKGTYYTPSGERVEEK